jgi:hypothetical protein
MLRCELDAHLGYDKHRSVKTNARNGFFIKKVKTSFRRSEIQVQEIVTSFNPIIVPRRQNMLDGLRM